MASALSFTGFAAQVATEGQPPSSATPQVTSDRLGMPLARVPQSSRLTQRRSYFFSGSSNFRQTTNGGVTHRGLADRIPIEDQKSK